jgi:zinc transport system substrate-binding protein
VTRITALLAAVLLLAACGGAPAAEDDAAAATTQPAPADQDDDGTAATDAPTEAPAEDAPEEPAGTEDAGSGLTVVTTVFALASIARDVAPGAEVVVLTASGQDPHDLELSPADRGLLESADAVLYLGDIGFQPQVESAVGDATGAVVSVAEVLGDDALRSLDHAHNDDDHSDDHGHDDDHSDDDHGHDDDGHSHDDDGVDPHVWFDASAMAQVAEAVGAALAQRLPDQADALQERAATLRSDLEALDAEIDDLLDDCARDVAIVSHEAYAYLLEPRDLEQEGISGAGGHGSASPQRLAELTQRIRDEGIPAVLAEPVEGRADAEALAAEAGVDLIEIDPLEIGTDALLETGYPQALREQAQAFATALECA